MRPGAKLVTGPRTLWAVWSTADSETDFGPVIAWRLDDPAGDLVPLVLGVDDIAARALPAGAHVAVYDTRDEAELAWRSS